MSNVYKLRIKQKIAINVWRDGLKWEKELKIGLVKGCHLSVDYAWN
ncbi:MAG: hypothetical protein ABR909_03580 [Candidatus Bathyarchaeia archaeon]|jgi:hypothetical protein